MKKSAFLALVVCGVMPLSSCNNNGDQSGYMQSTSAEANAKEAELAEQEFADLASKEAAGEEMPVQKAKHEKSAKHEATRKAARTPASKEIAKPVHVAGHGGSVYTVQLGAFKVKENAAKLAAKLKQDGFPVIMRPSVKSAGEMYLVHLEPTPNKTEAEKWQIDLKEKSFDSTLTSHRE